MSRTSQSRTTLSRTSRSGATGTPAPAGRRRHKVAAGVLVTLLATGLTLGAAATAQAHVRVSPDTAAPGSYATLTFKVPNESATASTTQVALTVPADAPISSVSYLPVAGWTTTVTTMPLPSPVTVGEATLTESVTRVVWKADDDAAIAPGQFQEFTISAGAIPETGHIVLPVDQTYSDGTVVSWDQETPSDGAEPENPAPVLYVTDTPAADSHGAAGHATTADATATTSADGGSTSTATYVSFAALALGAIALGIAVTGLRRPRTGTVQAGRAQASAPGSTPASTQGGNDA